MVTIFQRLVRWVCIAYEPSKFNDNTYVNATEVIQGHDGSITKSYGSVVDDMLLELEKEFTTILRQLTNKMCLVSMIVYQDVGEIQNLHAQNIKQF